MTRSLILLCAAAAFLAAAILPAAAQQPGARARKAARPPQRPLPPGVKAMRDIPYIPDGHALQKLDLYVTSQSQGAPLIVWIHGGAWSAGDKAGNPALGLLRQGYAVASLNYRLSQDAIFPAQIEDCKAAIRWLRANAAKFGYDPKRIGVWGSSAGGHLVALLGASNGVKAFDVGPNMNVSSDVQAVVDYYGPVDLMVMGKQSGPDSTIQHDAPDSPESRLVGGPIQQSGEKAAKASPLTYISKERAGELPPFLIMHGDKDNTVPIAQSEMLLKALKAVGADATYHVVKGGGHGGPGWNDPQVGAMVSEFFSRTLKNKTR